MPESKKNGAKKPMAQRNQKKNILVIGAGSIGRRHAANLASLGARVSIYDINADLTARISQEKGYYPVYDLDEKLKTGEYDAAVICTPTHLHISYAGKAAEAGLNLFVEKPLSNNLDGVPELLQMVEAAGLTAMAGFNLRYEPGLQYIKSIIDPENVAFALIELGSYLPSWREGIDYRQTYSANLSMGGGIILDDVHEVDYACWLFGYPEKVSCMYGKFSTFDIDVEDTAVLNMKYPDKIVTIHSDYLQRRYSRSCKICFRDGNSLEWTFGKYVVLYQDGKEKKYTYQDTFDVNDMYLREMQEFLDCLCTGKSPASNLENSAKILEIVFKAKNDAL